MPISESDFRTLESLVGAESGLDVLDGASTGADIRKLTEAVADRLLARHAASCHTVGGDLVWILPAWLLGERRSGPERNLRVVFNSNSASFDFADALTMEPLAPERLRNCALRRRRPAKRRQRRLAAESEHLLGRQNRVLGEESRTASILRRMVEWPSEAERDGLAIWNGFVDKCTDTLGEPAIVAGMTLEGLARLGQGHDGGRDRHWFLENYPWAFAAAIESGEAERYFERIEANRSRACAVAERLVCCQKQEACKKARFMAKRMPKYRAYPTLPRVLGRYSGRRDTQFRSILLAAIDRDKGELLAKIVRDGARTRRQLGYALEVILQSGRTGGELTARYESGILAFRSLAWSGFEPGGADPGLLAEGLTAVSADCLAGFASRLPEIPPGLDDEREPDPIDCGILALIGLFDQGERPELTGRQLIALSEGAAECGIHRVRALERTDIGSAWPGPPGWEAGAGDDEVRFLATPDAVRTEGRAMQNCLRYAESYISKSARGRLALFSIRTPGGQRATLSLKPVESASNGSILVERYAIAEFRGFRNQPPDPECLAVAQRVTDSLNCRFPLILSPEEESRRAEVRRMLNERRSFNDDPDAAEERWRELYLPLLPRRMAEHSPQAIVEEWSRKQSGTADG